LDKRFESLDLPILPHDRSQFDVHCALEDKKSVSFLVLHELNYKNPILYVIPLEGILGKLPVVPVGDTGTIPHRLRNLFPGAPGDRRPGSGDGCRMWFVNSWALRWSSHM
jgi:hypothetical protein